MDKIAEILKAVKESPDVRYGICDNVEAHYGGDHYLCLETRDWLKAKAREWIALEKGASTRSEHFPVAGHSQYDKERRAGTLWKSKRRHEYLYWLIEQAEKEGV
jgi:hypothetical protein